MWVLFRPSVLEQSSKTPVSIKLPPLVGGSTEITTQAELAPPQVVGLPGDGPLEVELRWLDDSGGSALIPKRGGFLNGRVYGANRLPLSNVRIEIASGPQTGLFTTSDSEGYYLLPDLLPGTHLFHVRSGSIRVGRMQRILPKGKTRRDFFLGQGNAITLEVRDFQNLPLVGAKVRVDLGETYQSNEDGVVVIPWVAKSPRVLTDISAEGHAAVRSELNLMPISTGPIVLPPLPRGGLIRGSVPSWPGGPRPTITVVPRSNRPGGRQFQWERWQNVVIGHDTFFELSGLPTDVMVDVRVFHPKGVGKPQSRAVKANADSATTVKFVVVRNEKRVKGRVVDEKGKGVSGAMVVLEAANPGEVLAAMFPGLREAGVSAQLPTPAQLRREMKTGRSGKFDFTWADHLQGSGHLVLSATKEGWVSDKVPVRNAMSDFSLKLKPENRSGSIFLALQKGRGSLPEVHWFLDGLPLRPDGDEGSSVSGLLLGNYSVGIRRGELSLVDIPSFNLQGAKDIVIP
jgi:hypothetical protein